ncbi:hypothetical protein [Microcoleus phage My-WqHQDG]|nr:hypothetical protein [Microcoleus phage My-WqHQDG]
MGVELGILMIGDLIIEGDKGQDILQYDQKPLVVVRHGGIVQLIIQEVQYLLGKTNNVLPWELEVAPIPTRTIVKIH